MWLRQTPHGKVAPLCEAASYTRSQIIPVLNCWHCPEKMKCFIAQHQNVGSSKPCTLLAWSAFLMDMPRFWVTIPFTWEMPMSTPQSQFWWARAYLWDFSGLATMNLFDNVIHRLSNTSVHILLLFIKILMILFRLWPICATLTVVICLRMNY